MTTASPYSHGDRLRHWAAVASRLRERLGQSWDEILTSERVAEVCRRVDELYVNPRLRDFVFEPFAGVFAMADADDDESAIHSVITMTALGNAAMAVVPAKGFVGIPVSAGLEVWMAWRIAQRSGVPVTRPADLRPYLHGRGSIAGGGLWLGRHVVGLGASIIPLASLPVEFVVTEALGITFWTGFENAAKRGSFGMFRGGYAKVWRRLRHLLRQQRLSVQDRLTRESLRESADRLREWLSGDMVVPANVKRGELAALAAMAALINNDAEALQGPLGRMVESAVRRAYSAQLGTASVEEMGQFFAAHTAEQRAGDISLIKGELFEQLVEVYENGDGDGWVARLHESRSVPGSDIVMYDTESGDSIVVSLKATSNPDYIEEALQRYPDTQIFTTSEMSDLIGEHPLVSYSTISNASLVEVTNDNYDELVEGIEPASAMQMVGVGVTAQSIVVLWPFAVAHVRGRIDRPQFLAACKRHLSDAGLRLASRFLWAAAMGPVFGPFLIARGGAAIARPRKPAGARVRRLVQREVEPPQE